MADFEELRLRVGLDDQASAGLAALRQNLAQLGQVGNMGRFANSTREMAQLMRPLAQGSLSLRSAMGLLGGSIGTAGVAAAGIGYALVNQAQQFSSFARDISAINRTAQTLGVSGADFENVVRQLTDEMGFARPEAIDFTANITRQLGDLLRTGGETERQLLRLTRDKAGMRAFIGQVTGFLEAGDLTGAINEIIEGGQRVYENELDRIRRELRERGVELTAENDLAAQMDARNVQRQFYEAFGMQPETALRIKQSLRPMTEDFRATREAMSAEADRFNLAYRELGNQWKGLGQSLRATSFPAMTYAIEGVNRVLTDLSGAFEQAREFRRWVDENFGNATQWVAGIRQSYEEAVSAMQARGDALRAWFRDLTFENAFGGTIAGATGIIVDLEERARSFGSYINGLTVNIRWPELPDWFKWLAEKIGAGFSAVFGVGTAAAAPAPPGLVGAEDYRRGGALGRGGVFGYGGVGGGGASGGAGYTYDWGRAGAIGRGGVLGYGGVGGGGASGGAGATGDWERSGAPGRGGVPGYGVAPSEGFAAAAWRQAGAVGRAIGSYFGGGQPAGGGYQFEPGRAGMGGRGGQFGYGGVGGGGASGGAGYTYDWGRAGAIGRGGQLGYGGVGGGGTSRGAGATGGWEQAGAVGRGGMPGYGSDVAAFARAGGGATGGWGDVSEAARGGMGGRAGGVLGRIGEIISDWRRGGAAGREQGAIDEIGSLVGGYQFDPAREGMGGRGGVFGYGGVGGGGESGGAGYTYDWGRAGAIGRGGVLGYGGVGGGGESGGVGATGSWEEMDAAQALAAAASIPVDLAEEVVAEAAAAPEVVPEAAPEKKGFWSKLNPFKRRQFGGPTLGGTPYLVGEAGPELFVPDSMRGGRDLQGEHTIALEEETDQVKRLAEQFREVNDFIQQEKLRQAGGEAAAANAFMGGGGTGGGAGATGGWDAQGGAPTGAPYGGGGVGAGTGEGAGESPVGGQAGRAGTGSGKAAAEAYLGRTISAGEYDALLRATHAESGGRNSPQEQAMIMGSILNRARSHRGGIMGALTAKNQFQAVTGTRYQPGPSAAYRSGPRGQRLESIEGAAENLLHRVPTSQVNFTAASLKAYGPGTNPGYLTEMKRTGGAVYGGTQFGGSLLAERQQIDSDNNKAAAATKVQSSGKLTANIVAPAGTQVRASGDGVFSDVEVNRSMPMEAAA